MAEWAVIPASEREQVIESTRREVARATVTASLDEILAWAQRRGLEFDIRYDHGTSVVDAYIAAQYEVTP